MWLVCDVITCIHNYSFVLMSFQKQLKISELFALEKKVLDTKVPHFIVLFQTSCVRFVL